MSLRATFAGAAAAIFDAFGDVPVSVSVRKFGEAAYDPETGTVMPSSADHVGEAFMLRFDQREVDGEIIRRSDVKCILKQAEFTVTPDPEDQVVHGSRVYDVLNVKPDPADATWTLHLRTTDA